MERLKQWTVASSLHSLPVWQSLAKSVCLVTWTTWTIYPCEKIMLKSVGLAIRNFMILWMPSFMNLRTYAVWRMINSVQNWKNVMTAITLHTIQSACTIRLVCSMLLSIENLAAIGLKRAHRPIWWNCCKNIIMTWSGWRMKKPTPKYWIA